MFNSFIQMDDHGNIAQIDSSEKSVESKIEDIKADFNSSFSNSVRKAFGEGEDIIKIDASKDIVYTRYKVDIYSKNNYDININIPEININSEVAKSINEEINNTFGKKTNSVVQSKNTMSIYNLDYVAYLNDDILSLVIKATLKEEDYAQRVIIKTYNYNVKTNQIVKLGNLITKKGIDANKVYDAVLKEIKEEITKNEAFAELGYEVYKRNVNDKMYLPENTDTFFMDLNDNLYLIYAYGNKNFTSEMDIIIL